MPFKRALAYSVVINLFFLGLCLVFGDLKFGAVDDYFMAARLTGALGTDYNPHLIFVNAIYGYALLPLYHLFPKIGWYYIGEMFSVFLSFTVIGYVLLQRCGEHWGAILATLFTAMFASDFYLVVQFTQCASILSAAGMLLFAYGVVTRRDARDCFAVQRTARNDELCESRFYQFAQKFSKIKPYLPFVLGIFLMLWGSVMRWQAFLMGMPFFCLGMLFILKDCWKVKWRVIIGLAVLFCSAFAMHHWDRNLYNSPKYIDFNAFQDARVALGDKHNYNHNAVYEDAEEYGLSGKDFKMLTEWVMYDTEVFSVDSLKQYTKMISAYTYRDPPVFIPRNLLYALENTIRSPLFWTWFALCLILFFSNPRKNLYSWASFFLILALMTYLISIGRLVYRVESGFWLYASVMSIPLFGKFTFGISKKFICTFLFITAIINVFSYATSGKVIRNPENGQKRTLAVEDSTDFKQVFKYIDSRPNMIFILPMNIFMHFSHHCNPPYLAEPIGRFRNIVSFGFWTPYLPEVKEALADYGISNPIRDIVHKNVIVLNEPSLKDFLKRHYYDYVAIDTLNQIGEMIFLKYSQVKETAE